MKQLLAIASGKGGVGKSTISVNIARWLSKEKKTLLVDCDMGLGNLDIMMNVQAKGTLYDVLLNEKTPEEILVHVSEKLDLLPTTSGTLETIGMDTLALELLMKNLLPLFEEYQYVICDLGAGVNSYTTTYIKHATSCVIVVTPDPSSMLDAYALLKILATRAIPVAVSIVVSMVENEKEGRRVYEKIRDVFSMHYKNKKIPAYLGSIPYDEQVYKCGYEQKNIMQEEKAQVFRGAIEHIGHKLSSAE